MFHKTHIQALRITSGPGEILSKFNTSEKPHIWRWTCDANLQKLLVYKWCTMVQVFWIIILGYYSQIIAFCKELQENKSLLIDEPSNQFKMFIKWIRVVLVAVFLISWKLQW